MHPFFGSLNLDCDFSVLVFPSTVSLVIFLSYLHVTGLHERGICSNREMHWVIGEVWYICICHCVYHVTAFYSCVG